MPSPAQSGPLAWNSPPPSLLNPKSAIGWPSNCSSGRPAADDDQNI